MATTPALRHDELLAEFYFWFRAGITMTIGTYRYGRNRLPRVLWILEEILAAPFLSVEKEMEVPAAD